MAATQTTETEREAGRRQRPARGEDGAGDGGGLDTPATL